jgi:dUTPase
MPQRGSAGSAGWDVHAYQSHVEGASVTIEPHTTSRVPTGIAMQIEHGYMPYVASRSGLAVDHSLSLLASIVDSDCNATNARSDA